MDDFASSASLSYTGCSVTIPENSIYAMLIELVFMSSQPKEIAISYSDSSLTVYNTVFRSDECSTASICGLTTFAATFHIWARYDGAATNRLSIKGWHMPSE